MWKVLLFIAKGLFIMQISHTSCCTLDTGSLFEGETRSDAILIHGVNEMSTEDVFAYFRDFAPGSVEWIDDSSCKSLISVI